MTFDHHIHFAVEIESCILYVFAFSTSDPSWRIRSRSSFCIKVASSPNILRKSHFSQQHLELCSWGFMGSGHYLHFLASGKYPYVSRYWKWYTIYWQLYIAVCSVIHNKELPILQYSFSTLGDIFLDGNNHVPSTVCRRERKSINQSLM